MSRKIARVFLAATLLGLVVPAFLGQRLPAAPTTLLGGALAGPRNTSARALKATFYVSWTYYKKNKKNGVVTRISSGKAGPYSTRRAAQSAVDNYLGSGSTSGGFYYYYSARVTGN